MDDRLQQAWRRCGARIGPCGRPRDFGDAAAELAAARSGAVLCDRSNLARLRATGRDFLPLLQRLSTADVDALTPGAGRPTILTSPKGRIVERLFTHLVGAEGVALVGGPGAGPRVLGHFARYTFAEEVGLDDVTLRTFQFAAVGPGAEATLAAAGLAEVEAFGTRRARLGGHDVQLLGHDGLSAGGRSVTGPIEAAADVWDALVALCGPGVRPAGDDALEAWRVLSGLPASGHELTEEHNPLEAGLWDAVSFDKGCYVGQEVVARLRTYDKVASALVGLAFPAGAPAPAPDRLFDGDQSVGTVTSTVLPPGSDAAVGLGYVKSRTLRPGLTLAVGRQGPAARVVDLPFP